MTTTLVNDRDALLQGASARLTTSPNAGVLLQASASGFHVSADGSTHEPASITFTATKVELDGDISFSISAGSTLTSITANSAVLNYADMGSSAVVTAQVVMNGQPFTRQLFVGKVFDGASGTVATYVSVAGPQVFSRADSSAAFAPTSVTLTATPTGGSATYQWQYWSGSAWVDLAGETAATHVVASGDFTDQRVYRVEATINGTVCHDQITLVQVTGGTNGVNAIAGFLTNESVTLAADNAGTVSTYAPAGGTFEVYDGITDKTGTAGVAYSVVSQTNCTATITGLGNYSVGAMSADTASATLQAIYGGVTLQKVLSLAKAKAGDSGSSVTGPRGAGHFYPTGSAWSDATADAACPGGKVVSDVVTISDGADFVMEKKWDGSAWNPTGVVIDGSLIVSNSVTASKINVNGLTVNKPDGTPILTVTGLKSGFEAPGTLNSDIVVGGRNLLPDSGFERGIHPLSEHTSMGSLSTSSSGESYLGSKALFFDGTGADMYVYLGTTVPVEAGKTYTLSFYYKSAGAITGSSTYFRQSDGGHTFFALSALGNQTTWTRHVQQWTCPAGITTLEPRFGITTSSAYSWMLVDCIQIEEGNAATQWNPAPEDVDAGISTAQAAADTANAAIANISSDNVLSKGEKQEVIRQWNTADGEHIPLANQADSLGVNRDAYWSAFSALANYLPSGWNDTTVDTSIVGADFRSKWNDYYTAKQALINALAAKAATLSTWAGTADRPYDVSNLVKKGTFEDGASGTWNGQGVENAVAGSPFSKEYVSHARDVFETDNAFDVTPGETLYFSAWLNTGATNYSGGFGVVIHDKAGTTILANTPCAIVAQIGWVYVEGSLVVPANGVNAQPWLFQNGTDFSAGNYLRAAGLWIGRHARGATIGADWASNLIGKPIDFRVVARGNSATSPVTDGLYKEGTFAYGSTRSYNVAIIRRSDAAFVEQQMFDVFNNGEVTGGRGAAEMAAMLNYYGPDCIAVVWTADEPQAHRLESGLDTALYRCGASRSVFGSPQFMYRSAYILVGICGCGEGNGVEAYQGAVNSDPNAWCDVAFSLLNGSVIGASGTYVPRTLADYSYTGDLDATAGATWGVNIGGSNLPADNATVGAPSGTYVGSTLAQTVEADAANGQSAYNAVNDAATGLANRLLNNARNVLSGGAGLAVGSLTWDSSGVRTGGYGVGINSSGIVGYNSSGAPTITIDASTGNVSVAGDISGSTGTFAGNLSSAGYVKVTGHNTVSGWFGTQNAAVLGTPSDGTANGLYGLTDSGYGIYAEASNTAATASGTGGFFQSQSGTGCAAISLSGIGLLAQTNSGDAAISAGAPSTFAGTAVIHALCSGGVSDVIYGESLGSGTGALGTSSSGTGVAGFGDYGVEGSGATYDFYANNANYGPFTGSHDGLLPKSESPEVGDILVDNGIIARKNVSNTISEMIVSSAPMQKTVIGVFVKRSSLDVDRRPTTLNDLTVEEVATLAEDHDRSVINAVGEGQINVCKENGDIAAGDYICTSSTAGKGMRQPDDVLHNYTVAKARESCTWAEGENDVRMIACSYHCA